jgi:hypothetical protein
MNAIEKNLRSVTERNNRFFSYGGWQYQYLAEHMLIFSKKRLTWINIDIA